MDYNHGTGHGVGYVLSVHEGPQRLHWRLPENQKVTALAEGMVVSNEPGYYAAGQFGIRMRIWSWCNGTVRTSMAASCTSSR